LEAIKEEKEIDSGRRVNVGISNGTVDIKQD